MPRTLQIESITTSASSSLSSINITGSANINTLIVPSLANVQNLVVSGTINATNLTISGASNSNSLNVASTLRVTGTTTLLGSSTLNNTDITGDLDVSGSLSVGIPTPDAGVKMQVVGILKATQFSGDGSLLTGIVGLGSSASSNFTVNNLVFTNVTGITTGGHRLYTNPSNTISLVRRIDLMNSNNTLVNTQMFYVPSTGSSVIDSSGDRNKFIDVDLPGKSSLRLLVPNGIVLSRTNDTIQAIIDSAGISGSLNIKIIGETGTASNIRMRDIVSITGISSVASGYVRNTSKMNVYNMIFHNTSSNVETVKVFDVRNVGGSVGTINSGNQILELTLSGADTLILGEEYNMILNRLESTNDSMQFSTTTSGAVNLMVFGETGTNV